MLEGAHNQTAILRDGLCLMSVVRRPIRSSSCVASILEADDAG